MMERLRKTVPIDLILLALRLFLGIMFLYAGALKIGDPSQFACDIRNYQFLPAPLINSWAVVLPWAEVIAGVLVILGIWSRASAGLIGLMFVSFVIALTAATARGLDINCGCFSGANDTTVNYNKAVTDLGMGLLSAPIIALGGGRFSLEKTLGPRAE